MCQERSAPRGNAVTEAAAHHLSWEAAGWPAVRVDQAGLPRQRLAILDHPDHVVGAAPDARAVHDDELAGVSEDLVDIGPQPPRSGAGVELRLNHDATADDVQPTSKSQRRGDFRLAVARLGDLDGRELCFHLSGHGHC